MPRACTLCNHPEREAIDQALAQSTPNRRIAAQYAVTEQAVRRHKQTHLPVLMVKAEEAREMAVADGLLGQVRGLQDRTLTMLRQAEEAGELRTALHAVREARANLELLAKLIGELDDRPQVNVLISPEWLLVRAALVAALEPYPEAKAAVGRRLLELETTGVPRS